MWTIDLQERDTTNETTSFETVGIVRNTKICNGRPTILGTRITVSDIVELHHLLGWDIQRILDEYPHLTKGQVIAALEYYEQHTEEIENNIAIH